MGLGTVIGEQATLRSNPSKTEVASSMFAVHLTLHYAFSCGHHVHYTLTLTFSLTLVKGPSSTSSLRPSARPAGE